MIRCNGFCSGRRELRERRTQVGEAAPSAELERPCCGASANIAARSTSTASPNFRRSLIGTPWDGPQNDLAKTWFGALTPIAWAHVNGGSEDPPFLAPRWR